MRAMGLDIGSVTVGVALSDGLKMIASSYTVIRYEQENEELFRKIVDIIKEEEVDEVIYKGGQREVSLSSLSSGDYTEIDKLLEILSKKYQDARVSFQLPSLKVNSFTLPLLEKLSEVRKSGLTFAVETPSDAWQLSLHKEVFKEK